MQIEIGQNLADSIACISICLCIYFTIRLLIKKGFVDFVVEKEEELEYNDPLKF